MTVSVRATATSGLVMTFIAVQVFFPNQVLDIKTWKRKGCDAHCGEIPRFLGGFGKIMDARPLVLISQRHGQACC
jgi:hypothetical protein